MKPGYGRFPRLQRIYADRTERGEYMVRLPDGFTGMAEPKPIRFPVRFAAGKREVQLCGEAF